MYPSYIPPWGLVLHIGVGLCPTPMCKTNTPQGGIQLYRICSIRHYDYYLFHHTILCSFYLRAAFIKLSAIGKIFHKCKGFEKSQFYEINKELRCGDLVLKQTSSFLISRRFATKQYLHGTSNPFSCFLLPMISHDDRPPCLKKC